MKILIGGPARQDERIFVEHLKSIDELELPEDVTLDRFYIINDCPELQKYLGNDEYIIKNTLDHYQTDEQTHSWSVENLNKMSMLRNMFLSYALKNEYDFAWFCDTDIILRPDTLSWLLAAKKDIVAEIFWTKSDPKGKAVWPNCWEFDQSYSTDQAYRDWMTPGVYRVGGTGACMLISKDAIKSGANYTPFYNLRQALFGEDRWFMLRAVAAGFELYVDTHSPVMHLYRPSEYEKFMEDKYGNSR